MKLWLRQRITSDAVFAAQVFLAGAVTQSIASIAWTALHARGRSDLTAWLLWSSSLSIAACFILPRLGLACAEQLCVVGPRDVDFLCMVVLLRIQRVGHGTSPCLLNWWRNSCFVGIFRLLSTFRQRGNSGGACGDAD